MGDLAVFTEIERVLADPMSRPGTSVKTGNLRIIGSGVNSGQLMPMALDRMGRVWVEDNGALRCVGTI